MDFLPEALLEYHRRTPDAVALIDDNRRVTYKELHSRAQEVARGLLETGLRPGDRVATVLPNSTHAVELIYGTWFAGGVIVPLSTHARAHEVASLSRHADVRLLVHEPEYRDLGAVSEAISDSGIRAVTMSELVTMEGPGLPASPASRKRLDSNGLAMLLYTSGTSGQPKGVMLTHGNLAANVASIVDYLELSSRDRVLSVLPFNYSYGSSVLHTHLAVGGSVVIERNFVFPQVIVETMARERVTGFSGVPSTFALLLSRTNLAAVQLDALRYVTQAGAAMSSSLVTQLRAALPKTQIFIMYGQTEATARLSYVPPERLSDKLGSAGIPVRGVSLTIRDDHGRSLGARETGEVWAQGPNLMQGYWRDEAGTREVLRDGWLKTGDMGYLDEDGYLFLVGRRTDIIKTGAHRVHPLEIEEAISGLPGVREVAVAGIEDEILGQAITAFVVREHGSDLFADRIKERCRERLASFKVPKHVHFVEQLPRTSSGKLQRSRLASGNRRESA